jgi:hypothetical protein
MSLYFFKSNDNLQGIVDLIGLLKMFSNDKQVKYNLLGTVGSLDMKGASLSQFMVRITI